MPLMPDAPMTGLILCGGRGQRLGGIDKGWIRWQGQPLIAHQVGYLLPHVTGIVIVANRHSSEYSPYGTVVSDPVPGYPGPLAGLIAGLDAMPTDWAFVIPVDMPCLPQGLGNLLRRKAHASNGRPVVCHDGEHPQPLVGLFSKAHLPSMRNALAGEKRSPIEWCRSEDAQWLDVSTMRGAFLNVNTPEDLERLESGGRISPVR